MSRPRRVVDLPWLAGIAVMVAAAVSIGPVAAGRASSSSAPAPAKVRADAGVPRATPAQIVPVGDRRSLDFDKGWRFALVNASDVTNPTGAYADAEDPRFDDSAWRAVDLPHDWSIEGLPVDRPGTGTSSATGFFQGGLGWYRKTFTLPAAMLGKAISVEFDGVYMDSATYLNGHELGTHAYGYTGFAFDISRLVHADGSTPNVLAVKVQNRLPSSRWYSGSGIYRNVRLVVTDPVHVSRWGTFVTTPTLAATLPSGYATVHVSTTIDDAGAQRADVTIASKVLDRDGAVVAQATTDVSVDPGGSATLDADVRVEAPTLWSLDRPYLYRLQTDLVVAGKTVDAYLTTFGIRSFQIDPSDGFSLNGQHLKIQGVDLHHDEGALGAATSEDAIRRQLSILKGMGVNAVRTAHNPPSPELIRVCEELGIVLLVEAFDSWSNGKSTYDYGRFFDADSDADIAEMVNAAKDSPAVIMWSIGNEIRDATVADARRLIGDIKAIDPTRPVVWGSDAYRGLPASGSTEDQIAKLLDGVGLNYDDAASIDALHARYPETFFFASESSSATSTRGAYQDPTYANTGEDYTPGRMATSSYDNNLASWTMSGEYSLQEDRDRRYLAGQFLWSGFDYIGEPTPYDVFPVKTSFFGAVDTAGLPKDHYWLFRSQWTSQPMVHLLPMDWTDHEPGEDVEVWAYANVDTVELFLNGRSLGVRTFDHKETADGRAYLETGDATGQDGTTASQRATTYISPNGSTGKLHLAWSVPFEPGVLLAVARQAEVEVARDELHTAGPAAGLRLTTDRAVIPTDGAALAYVAINVVDDHGVRVPGSEAPIDLDVRGGTLAGMDDGRQESAEGYRSATHRAFHGQLVAIVRSTEAAGAIMVTATSPGLPPAITTLFASDATGSGVIAIEPTFLRVPLGGTVTLPATVRAVHADGIVSTAPVTWRDPAPASDRSGVATVVGAVEGMSPSAQAVVTTYALAGVESWSTVVPVGRAPLLPSDLRVVYDDGGDALLPVTWDAIDAGSYASPGTFTVPGRVTGSGAPAVATIRVTDDVTSGQDIALAASLLRPVADASFSGSPDTLPAAMLDGDGATRGWSSLYRKEATAQLHAVSAAHPREWVSVAWPNAQRVDNLSPFFVVDAKRALPAAVTVSYWTGAEWRAVSNPAVDWATGSREPTAITFDPVTTSRIRLDMTSPAPDTSRGFMGISELAVDGEVVAYQTTAALSDLRVAGQTVPGFDAALTDYAVAVTGTDVPTIAATAAANGRVLVVPPRSLPGTATVLVTSEEGLSTRTYSVHLAPVPSSAVGSATVPGAVGRATAPLDVRYAVDVTLAELADGIVATLQLDVRNTSGRAIDHLDLQTAGNVPIRVTAATVDGQTVATRSRPRHLVVSLGGGLPDAASATIMLGLTIPLGRALAGDGWFHARRDGVVQLSEWLPRVDRGFSDVIEAHVHAPAGMVVGIGSLDHARELPIVASRGYAELDGTAAGTTLRILYRAGSAGRAVAVEALRDAQEALPWIVRRLGPQPRRSITIAQVNSTGWAYSWPGIVWLPDDLKVADIPRYLAHELAHQWFGGIAPTDDPRLHPFAAEGPVELMSRLFQHRLRPSLCPGMRLDLPRSAYGSCFYEAIYVDGANLLDRVRRRMGDRVYWAALRGYLSDHRFGVVDTQDLITALERASPADLRPILRGRFAHL